MTVFSRGKIRNIPVLYYGNNQLDVVFNYPYLGIVFNYNGKFTLAQNELYKKTFKPMFSILAKRRSLGLAVDTAINVFNTCIKPIMLYACGIWGPYDAGFADKLQLRFFKICLYLKQNTPSVIILWFLEK